MDSFKTAIYAVEVAIVLHILFISQKFGIPCPIKKCSPIYTMNCSYNVCFMSQCSCKLILLLSQDGSYKQVQINYKKKTRNIRFCYEGSNSWKSRCIWVLNSILAHAQMTRPYPQ